jgi:hypothetical protein
MRSSASDVYSIAQRAVWHPDGESIYILYYGTTMVHWDLTKDETSEFNHTQALDMAISSDGTLLMTCDFRGALSVWALPRFNLIYQLHGNDFVCDMAFSPDSRRIYNTKDSLCCVWEPDALVRPDDIDRHGDDLRAVANGLLASDAVPEPVYSQDTSGSGIRTLAYESGGEFYCCGREDGTVSIYDIKNGELATDVCSHGLNSPVVSLGWSPSGRFLANGDIGEKVIVKSLRMRDDQTWIIYPVFEAKILDKFADQFGFSRDEHFLLISVAFQDQVWDLRTKSQVWGRSREESSKRSGQWIDHPFDKTRLLLVEQNRMYIHQWRKVENELVQNIVTATVADGLAASQPMPATSPDMVEYLVETNKGLYLVCQTSPEDDDTRSRDNDTKGLLSLLQTSDIQGPASTPQEHVRRRPLCELSAHVQRLLGCYRGRVAFIDHAHWYVVISTPCFNLLTSIILSVSLPKQPRRQSSSRLGSLYECTRYRLH